MFPYYLHNMYWKPWTNYRFKFNFKVWSVGLFQYQFARRFDDIFEHHSLFLIYRRFNRWLLLFLTVTWQNHLQICIIGMFVNHIIKSKYLCLSGTFSIINPEYPLCHQAIFYGVWTLYMGDVISSKNCLYGIHSYENYRNWVAVSGSQIPNYRLLFVLKVYY